MYSTSGLVYRIFLVGCPLLITGIVCIIKSNFWNTHKRKNSVMILAICILIFEISYIGVFTYKANNPYISTCEGAFVEQRRDSLEAPFTDAYVFDTGNDLKKRLYLDVFSKKKIYPCDLEEGSIYKITFDKHTSIILKIEKIL